MCHTEGPHWHVCAWRRRRAPACRGGLGDLLRPHCTCCRSRSGRRTDTAVTHLLGRRRPLARGSCLPPQAHGGSQPCRRLCPDSDTAVGGGEEAHDPGAQHQARLLGPNPGWEGLRLMEREVKGSGGTLRLCPSSASTISPAYMLSPGQRSLALQGRPREPLLSSCP